MHPKNSFHLRLLFRVASGLFLLVGPCVAYNLYDAQALNGQLVAEGHEVEGEVHALADVSGTGGVQYSKGKDRCAFTARFRPSERGDTVLECQETFDYPCPALDDVRESTVTFLPSDPSRCRILRKAAIAADGETGSSLTTLLWILGLALVAFLASFIAPKPGQTTDDSPVEG
ncbi:MAG: hypothetical protein CMH55_02705 [Myxococcales bacterium]|nr:hypothetical protein [Myxococcales bacterium]